MTVEQADIEAILGRVLTEAEEARVDRLTEMAEAQVESMLPGFAVALDSATDEVIPYSDPDIMWTKRYPVSAVDAVKLDGTALDTADYRWTEMGEIRLLGGGRLNSFEINLARFPTSAEVTVTYDYGLDPLPADMAAAVASVVAALLQRQAINPDGVQSESLGAYSVTYAEAAAGSGGLAPAPGDLLRRWKRTRRLSVPFVRTR